LQRNTVAMPRSLVELDVEYWGPRAPTTGKTKDVSVSGAFILTQEPYPPGTLLKLRLTDPGIDRPITLDVEVARMIPAGGPEPAWGCGLYSATTSNAPMHSRPSKSSP